MDVIIIWMFIWTQFIEQLLVGLLAQLVERCTGIAEVMGSWLVCSAHFKPEGMYRTITERTRLKPGVVPSQFAWTKEDKKRRQKKLQELKTADQQAQEERRQFLVG